LSRTTNSWSAKQAVLLELGSDAVPFPDLLHRALGGGVDAQHGVELRGLVAEERAHALQRRLGERAMGVPPGRRAVVELVHRRVEEVGRHFRRPVGQDPHRLFAIAEQALAGRDLPGEVGEAGPEGRVELDVARDHGEEMRRTGRGLDRLAQGLRSAVRGEDAREVVSSDQSHRRRSYTDI
jgi:hypothetical protein